MDLVLYIHGMGGSAGESRRFGPLFPGCEITGLDYKTFTPWETGREIRSAVNELKKEYESITLIANSIGAFFSLHADIGSMLKRAYFISPVVDMERLILDVMRREGVEQEELKARGVISTRDGTELTWEYLCYIREHPVEWDAPTEILYGELDSLVPFDTVSAFAKEHGAGLTVMEGAEHWFHTEEQLCFIDEWIKKSFKTI